MKRRFLKWVSRFRRSDIAAKARDVGRPSVTAVDAVLHALVAHSGAINIVQVGANDGSFSDPIFGFVKDNPERTRVVLVEPQPDIAEILARNYAFHPHKQIVSAAVGDARTSVVMYRVAKRAWSDYVRGRSGPDGDPHNATGVTSMSREHVLRHLRKKLGRKRDDLDQFIEELQVPCRSLKEIVDDSKLASGVDFLQVDTEGFDDKVVLSALESNLHPTAINLEIRHIPDERRSVLMGVLQREGYQVLHWKRSDMLAFRWPRQLSRNHGSQAGG